MDSDVRNQFTANKPKPSIHPWYYVPGKSYLIERRLSSKHEADHRRQRENERFHKYFEKCRSDTALQHNWQLERPLVKYHFQHSSAPPFFTEPESQKVENRERYEQYLQKASTLYSESEAASLKFQKSQLDVDLVVKCLFEYLETFKTTLETRRKSVAAIKRHLDEMIYTPNRDPLRQVCFLTRELLYFYKTQIFNNIKHLRPIMFKHIYTEEERTELHELNNRCFQIIDMYIQLNEIRNQHFQQMYNEERENAWTEQRIVWRNEMAVWDKLAVQLFKLNSHMIFHKLDSFAKNQQKLLQDKASKIKALRFFVEEIQSDPNLRPILYHDVHQF